MQVGGNANAVSLPVSSAGRRSSLSRMPSFNNMAAITTDAQQKYNSRAANLYREKLHQLATKALKQHGTKPLLDEGHRSEHGRSAAEKKEDDFFHEHSQAPLKTFRDDVMTLSSNSNDPALDKSQFASQSLSCP